MRTPFSPSSQRWPYQQQQQRHPAARSTVCNDRGSPCLSLGISVAARDHQRHLDPAAGWRSPGGARHRSRCRGHRHLRAGVQSHPHGNLASFGRSPEILFQEFDAVVDLFEEIAKQQATIPPNSNPSACGKSDPQLTLCFLWTDRCAVLRAVRPARRRGHGPARR